MSRHSLGVPIAIGAKTFDVKGISCAVHNDGASAAFRFIRHRNFHTVIANVGDLQAKFLGKRAAEWQGPRFHIWLLEMLINHVLTARPRGNKSGRQHGDDRAAGIPVAMLAGPPCSTGKALPLAWLES